MKMKKYKAAIIGCGRMGWLFDEDPLTKKPCSHAGAYTSFEKTELVAVCDIDKERLDGISKRYNVKGKYLDYKEMLDKEEIDILSICTHEHGKIFKYAAGTGKIKAIFCEKPFSNSMKEGEEMLEASKKYNIPVTVDHTRRWDPTFRKMKELVDKKTIGYIDTINAFCTVGWMNGGTHLFDILRFYIGDAEWVQGHIVDDPSCDPGGRALIKFKNGSMCFVDSMWRDYVYFGADLIGSKGTMKTTGMIRSKQGIEVSTAVKSKGESGINELKKEKIGVPECKPPLIEALEEIVKGIETGKPTSCTGEDGLKAVEIALAVHESHSKGNIPILLPLKNKTLAVKSRFTSFTKDGNLA